MPEKTSEKKRRARARSGRVPAVATFQGRVDLAMRARGFVPGTKEGVNALARAMGKSQGFVSRQLRETKDPRISTAILFAKTLRIRIEWLLLETGPMEVEAGPGSETNASLPGWAEAATQVRGVPAYAVDAVASRPIVLHPERVTVEYVRALAAFWLSWAPEAEDAARRDADRVRRREDGPDKAPKN